MLGGRYRILIWLHPVIGCYPQYKIEFPSEIYGLKQFEPGKTTKYFSHVVTRPLVKNVS